MPNEIIAYVLTIGGVSILLSLYVITKDIIQEVHMPPRK